MLSGPPLNWYKSSGYGEMRQYDDGDSSILASPQFPGNYPNSIHETHEITASIGPIEISFSHFATEKGCDFVSITDGDGTVLLSRASGNSIPRNITSQTNKVVVEFQTDGTKVFPGWKLHWQGQEGWNTDRNQFCECCD